MDEDSQQGGALELSTWGDGLYLQQGDSLHRLDHPNGLPELNDRDSVLAVALCELAIQRLLRDNCRCSGHKTGTSS